MVEGYVEANVAPADVLVELERWTSILSSIFTGFLPSLNRVIALGIKPSRRIKAAILAHNPTFEFIPYRQAGYSSGELQQILKKQN